MKLINILFLLVLLSTPILSIAQKTQTSLREIWESTDEVDSIRFLALEDFYEKHHQSQPDSALLSLDYYYQLAKEKNATRQMYRALNRKANIYRLKGEFEKSKGLYQRAGELAAKMENPVLQAIIIGNIGNVFLRQQDYQQATRHYYKALKIFREEKDEDGEGRMLLSLGSVNHTIGNLDLALDFYQKSLKKYQTLEPEGIDIAIISMNIGLMHFENELYSEAISSFEKALEILEINNDKFYTAGCYATLAEIHLELNELDKAKLYSEKNLVLNKELGIQHGLLNGEITAARIMSKTNINEATIKAEGILANLPSTANHSSKKTLYELLYNCYKDLGKFDLSLKMLEQFTKYQDSIQQKKNSFAVASELVRNDFETRLSESKLASEKEKRELKDSQSKRTLVIVLTSGILVAIILFYFILKGQKNSQRRSELLTEIKELKSTKDDQVVVDSNNFKLSREKIEIAIGRKLNETDWKVLQILLEDPVITNKEIAEKAFLSVDGIGSSLRRMYEYFSVKESKYKKISLLLEAVKISNQN